MSWSAPRPRRTVAVAPPRRTSGDCARRAFWSAVTVFVTPGPGRDRRDARDAREPADGVGREDGGRLVPRVDDAEAARLRRREDRRDVPAAEGEEELHAVPDEDLGDELAPVRHEQTPYALGPGRTFHLISC